MLNSMAKLCLRVHQQGSSDKASAEVSPQSFIWLFNKAAFLCHTYHKAGWLGWGIPAYHWPYSHHSQWECAVCWEK